MAVGTRTLIRGTSHSLRVARAVEPIGARDLCPKALRGDNESSDVTA
jgi:hypothetical protein